MKFAHANNLLWTQGSEEPRKAKKITSRNAFQIVVFVGCAVKARVFVRFCGNQFLCPVFVRVPSPVSLASFVETASRQPATRAVVRSVSVLIVGSRRRACSEICSQE